MCGLSFFAKRLRKSYGYTTIFLHVEYFLGEFKRRRDAEILIGSDRSESPITHFNGYSVTSVCGSLAPSKVTGPVRLSSG